MEKAAGRILKNHDVKMEGLFRLKAGQTSKSSGRKKSGEASSPPQVRIVEKHPEFAVVEVICSCGEKTDIRCEYAAAQSTEQEQGQQDDGENDNAS